MEVRKGYKQTEVGVIPEDWDVDCIGNVAQINTGGRNTQDRIEDGVYPFFVRSQTVERINSYSFDGEAILTAGDGVGTGKVFHYINGKFDAHQRVYQITNFNERIKGYYFYLYFSNHFYKRIMQMTAKSSVDSVRMEMIAKMLIPLPPVAEQEAIAEALSDADALIESLETLLAKKRQVKQGAMSELLSGKRRLAGFSGEWEVKEMGDLGLDISDGNYSGMYPKQSDFKTIGVPFIRANNIKGMKVIDDDMRFISTDKHNELLKGHLKKDDILITTRGELGNIALVPDRHVGSNINAQIVRINTRKTINPIYLAFYLSYEDVQNKIKGAETGSALKQLPVGKLVKIPVVLPPLPEQTAIAEILSDIDAEIRAVEEKLSKARAVKAGMMSELLTGRVRLV